MKIEKGKEVLKKHIENVKDDYIISDYCENCGNIQAIETVLSELETLKKIAEKLAKYIEQAGILHKSIPINKDDINSPRTVGTATTVEIINWARKEIENG